jgi:hypothetical protein
MIKFFVADAKETSNLELNTIRVGARSITAVVMLKLKWWKVGNGPVINVDRRDSGC